MTDLNLLTAVFTLMNTRTLMVESPSFVYCANARIHISPQAVEVEYIEFARARAKYSS